MEAIPATAAPFDFFMVPIIETYYRIGDTAKADEYLKQLSDVTQEELVYFLSLDKKYAYDTDYEKQIRMHTMQELVRLTSLYSNQELFENQQERFEQLVLLYQSNA